MAISDLLAGTPLQGLGGSASQIFSILGNLLVLVVLAAMAIGVIWLWSRRRSYSIPTPIFSKRSGGLKFFTDKASYSKDKKTNIWDFRFKDLKEITSPPPYKVLMAGVKGANVAVYYQNSAGELYPCEVEIVEPKEFEEKEMEVILPDGTRGFVKQKIAKCKLKIIEPDIALWSTQMDDKLLQAYGQKTWWDKYGNYLMFFGTATLVLVLIYLVLKKIDVVTEAARLFKEGAETLKATGVKVPSTAP